MRHSSVNVKFNYSLFSFSISCQIKRKKAFIMGPKLLVLGTRRVSVRSYCITDHCYNQPSRVLHRNCSGDASFCLAGCGILRVGKCVRDLISTQEVWVLPSGQKPRARHHLCGSVCAVFYMALHKSASNNGAPFLVWCATFKLVMLLSSYATLYSGRDNNVDPLKSLGFSINLLSHLVPIELKHWQRSIRWLWMTLLFFIHWKFYSSLAYILVQSKIGSI